MQIKDELNSVHGDFTPSFTTVKFWAAEFKRDRKSLGNDECSMKTDENRRKHRQSSPKGASRPPN